jgi:flagellar capping protein FliD
MASPDPAIASLLGYDPSGAQGLTQTSAAQSTKLNVNGIEVTSNSTTSPARRGPDLRRQGLARQQHPDVTRDTGNGERPRSTTSSRPTTR